MEKYHENLLEEEEYLKKTLELIEQEIKIETSHLLTGRGNLIASGKSMWEDSVHYSNDFEKMIEVSQYLSEIASQTSTYRNTAGRIKKYEKMISSPYFGRFEFIETGLSNEEKIYIGLYNLMDSKTNNIMVYDWRSPIASVFYRFEPGKASYQAPFGEISGEVASKRQYKIVRSRLKYFFDCSIRISDEILQEVLSRNSSSQMRNIVETIQKDQDIIIRDMENELLIVQGAAGSGKTSVALHRIAFLLYEGMGSKLGSNNIIIISPNTIFSKYISGILPELGEENVEQTTVEELLETHFEGIISFEGRNAQLESVINCSGSPNSGFIRACIRFKGSNTLKIILDRYLWHFEHKMLQFDDVYYNGVIIENKQELKNSFLNNKIGMPAAKRLKRIESKLLEKIHPIEKLRLEKIKDIVRKKSEHQFEINPFSRYLSIKDMKKFTKELHRFSQIDILKIYKMLFFDKVLFYRLSKGLDLPDNIERILDYTKESFNKDKLFYEDMIPLLYLKLKVEGNGLYSEIKQVVVDEAQDYYPLYYEVFKLLFKDARYTVLGDVSQRLDNDTDYSLYNDIEKIFDKRNTAKIFLNKTYRSSYEINLFSQKFLSKEYKVIPFERHEKAPGLIYEQTYDMLENRVLRDAEAYLEEGFESVAIICKTNNQAEKLYSSLKNRTSVKLLDETSSKMEKGILVLPVFQAKGLEFDAVMVFGTDMENYKTDFDRKLLYIACTRALHRLGLYYTGEKCGLF